MSRPPLAGGATAKGDYVVFIDSDVVIPDINNFFNTALEDFSDEPRLVALTVRYRVFPEMSTWADNLFFGLLCFDFLVSNNVFHVGASAGEFQMIQRDVFNRVGGFNEKLAAAEDMDMFRRLSKVGRTRFEKRLSIYHTGRRAHTIGWPKLLWEWFANTVSVFFFKKSASKEWKEIR